MIEIVLGMSVLLNIAFGVFFYFHELGNKRERQSLLNAIISRTPEQFRDLELTAKVEPIKAQAPKPPDLIAESDLPDDEFKQYALERETEV